MAKRMKQKPLHRQPPSQVELEARRYRESKPPRSATDDPTDDALLYDDDMLDRIAAIQQGWDDTTMWLRSMGVTDHAPTPALVAHMRMHLSYGIIATVRVFKIDRARFGYNEWLRGDFSEELPPDEYAEEVERAIKFTRSVQSVSRRVVDDGPKPAPDAVPVAPTFGWTEGGQWKHSPHSSDAPLNAYRGVEFDIGGERVLRVDNKHRYMFVHKSTRVYRTFPNK